MCCLAETGNATSELGLYQRYQRPSNLTPSTYLQVVPPWPRLRREMRLSRLSPFPAFASQSESVNHPSISIFHHLPSIWSISTWKIRKDQKDQNAKGGFHPCSSCSLAISYAISDVCCQSVAALAALVPFTAGFSSQLRGLTSQAEPSCFWWDFQMRSMTCTRS